ncbi:MarR family transcriptional regulator [Corallococcus sp. CA053C]|uniref:MarR family winged helix-turn-helix transcriptional regulator n=1 Tax=Corallococcus sp. CA053C TaxID=2316732 RepID=UPI000EA27A33|nr:MarR family winged helix-turn-helix transcriptional regulator [Corallococcus sp. CA053C]RKH15450.1 MarR family transcriptional regulator [Corallococcus sp. CA053C]
MPLPDDATLGTLLRHLTELMDGAVEQAYGSLSLEYRPRYTPVVRTLLELGSASIRTISEHAGISHSAASQTVSQMARSGLVSLRAGGDARERIVVLTPAAEAVVPALRRQWAITQAAAQAFDEELSMPLSQLLREAIAALERRPFSERLASTKPPKPPRKNAQE